LQLRVAEVRDADAIVSVINAAFAKAESFLLDRDRIDLQTVRDLLQEGTFLVANGQRFDRNSYTCASRTYKLGTILMVSYITKEMSKARAAI
jgi:hypothetical protein